MEYGIEYDYNERFMRKEQSRFKDNVCQNIFVIRVGEGMWLLDCEFEIKWNMFAGVIHVENGTCTLGMVEEKVCELGKIAIGGQFVGSCKERLCQP